MPSSLDLLGVALAGRYRFERELGAGGMATVYLAHDLKHDRDVAIKVLHPELAAALGAERFLSEIKTTARLQHPHILPLLDSGEAGGLLYYVMPYVTGETLRARLERERQLPIDDALRIAREVADALGSAHALGIIHRDIKPENILLQGGHALVADFGIALAVQQAGGPRMTQTGLSLGTPQYMSPEQAMGERNIDLRSDLYALGAVTYEMLVGEAPFTGPSVQAIVARVMTEQPRGIVVQRKAVPAGVEVAVMRALEKLPADRYSSAAEFATALGAQVAPASVAPRAKERRGVYVLIAVTAAVMCLAGGWLLGRGATRAGDTAAWSTSIVLPDSLALEPLITNTEGVATIALSPDGSQLVFVSRVGRIPKLFIRRLSDFSVRAIDGTEGAVAPFYSPSGDAVGFFAGNAVKRVTLADGRVTTLAPNIVDGWGGTWAPDGRVFVSSLRASQLEEIGPGGDSIRTISCPNGCSFPELLPDGRRIVASGASVLEIIDIQQGTIRRLLPADAKSAQDHVRGMSARYDGDGHLVYVGPGGQVLAVSFDAKLAKVIGRPAQVIDGVRVETGRGAAQFALSRSGVLVFAPGPVMSVGILVRADRNGKLDTIPAPAANYSSLELTPDGNRIVTRVVTATGDATIEVVDALSGKITPWISRPSLGRPDWASDARRVVFARGRGEDSGAFIGDPELSAPPERLRLPANIVELHPLADDESYHGWVGDTLMVMHTNGSPSLRLVAQTSGGATSSDGRWFMSEEPRPTSAIVARSLDGTGRRVVIAGDGRFSMVEWAAGGHEFIVADAQPMRLGGDAGQTLQGFYSVSYDPTKPDPFGAPRPLFRAIVADFPGRNYTVGMAGNRFVFKQHIATPSPREIRVMRNWHQRLLQGARP